MGTEFYFTWRHQGHKYNYNTYEVFLMVLITGISNFSCIPSLILLYKKNMIYAFYTGVFTFITSFMYHFTESIGSEKIFMTEYEWHILGKNNLFI